MIRVTVSASYPDIWHEKDFDNLSDAFEWLDERFVELSAMYDEDEEFTTIGLALELKNLETGEVHYYLNLEEDEATSGF